MILKFGRWSNESEKWFCCPCSCEKTSGIQISGKSWVLINKIGDGFAAILPLQELGNGTADEYKDVSGNQKHGTAGNSVDPETFFDVSTGVACQKSQLGTNSLQFITLPADEIGVDQGFAVSLWTKISTNFVENPIFSRGDNFILSTSFLNHLMSTVVDSFGNSHTAFSDFLEQEKWYHIASSWSPGQTLKIFVNGVLSGESEQKISELRAISGNNLIGSVQNGRGFVGNLQEVKIHASARSEAWFRAEYENYCVSDFFEVV